MTENMRIWEQVNRPPAIALEAIKGGRLVGKTSINPQWRLQMATEIFGPQGIGWYVELVEHWTEPGAEGETIQHVHVHFHYKDPETGEWSKPVLGVGGKVLVKMEGRGQGKPGLGFSNDEALKMAVTDGIGVALKGLGFGADVYFNLWDGCKYRDLGTDESAQVRWSERMLEASEGPIKEFSGWWGRNKETIVTEIGTESAAILWEAFNARLQEVRKEEA